MDTGQMATEKMRARKTGEQETGWRTEEEIKWKLEAE